MLHIDHNKYAEKVALPLVSKFIIQLHFIRNISLTYNPTVKWN